MSLENASWILMAMSIIGTIFVVYKKMIPGMFLNFIASGGWSGYYYYIEEYPSAILLGIFVMIYLWGLVKHNRERLKSKNIRVEEGIEEDSDIEQPYC